MHTQGMGVDEDEHLNLYPLGSLNMSEWAFKGGFCIYALSTQISRAGQYSENDIMYPYISA